MIINKSFFGARSFFSVYPLIRTGSPKNTKTSFIPQGGNREVSFLLLLSCSHQNPQSVIKDLVPLRIY